MSLTLRLPVGIRCTQSGVRSSGSRAAALRARWSYRSLPWTRPRRRLEAAPSVAVSRTAVILGSSPMAAATPA